MWRRAARSKKRGLRRAELKEAGATPAAHSLSLSPGEVVSKARVTVVA
jgi:hypothetical protein